MGAGAGPLCATDSGFSLHAATIARRDDARGQEALLRYVLRPPLAQSRLQTLDNGLCRITLKRTFSDGTYAIDLDPLSLLCRLAAAVPPASTPFATPEFWRLPPRGDRW